MMDEKIIFLHIPKTAGSSLRHLVSQQYSPEDCLFLYYPLPYDEVSLGEIHNRLSTAKILYGHVGFGIHHFLGIQGKYIAFLRNPIERVISFYKHNANDVNLPHYTAIQEGMSLAEMLTVHPDNHMTRILANHWSPIENDAHVLEQALENIRRSFCFIGLVEYFEESVIRLSRCLGWKTGTEIPYLNVSTEMSVEIDLPTQILLEQHNRLDIRLYENVRAFFHAEEDN